MNILYILLATIISAAITYFISRRKQPNLLEEIETAADQSTISQAENDLLAKYQQLQNKYEILVSDSTVQIERLNKEIKIYQNGNFNEISHNQLAEIDKLKRKIKETQDDIEEYEEEIDNYQQKIKKIEKENYDLQIEIDNKNREIKKQREDLEQTKKELEEKERELDIKKESQEFIREILTAKQTNDKNIKELYQKVDNMVHFIKEELRGCLNSIKELKDINYFQDNELARWAAYAKKEWIQGKTTIAFVGEFSAGKTSIVNRILSQDNPNIPQLPVSTKASTAIPTYISGGLMTNTYGFVTPDNILKKIPEQTFKRVNKEVLDQIKGISSLIQYFIMSYNNENLKDLSILDTPGFTSNDKEDAERTISVINECDALFWVFDVNSGTINRSSLNIIREHLKKPLYIIINKTDTKAPLEIDNVENLIRKTLQDENISIEKIIRFSSKAPLCDIMDLIKTIKHDDGQKSYIRNLSDWTNDLISEKEKEVSQLYQTFNYQTKKADDYTNNITNDLYKLYKSCYEAINIPRWEEHFFSSNRYEMDKEEGDNLKNILRAIAEDQLEEIKSLIEKRIEIASKVQEAYSRYKDRETDYCRLRNIKEQFDKLIK